MVMFPQCYHLVKIFNLQKIPNLKLKQSIGDFFVFTQTSSNFAKAWNGLRKNTKLYIEQCLVHKKGYLSSDTWLRRYMMLFGSNNMQLEKFSEKLFSKVLHTEGFKIPYFFLSSGNFGSIHAHIAHQKRQEIVSLVKIKQVKPGFTSRSQNIPGP